jgi:uncharacterized cupredoxin-like copper-binding protein
MTRILIGAALAAFASVASAQAVAVPVKLSEWKIDMKSDTVKAGAVIFRVTNEGGMNHGFYVRGEGVDKGTREIPVRQSASLAVTLKPGTYEIFCPMSDDSHQLAGMKKTLVVTPADSPAPKKP